MISRLIADKKIGLIALEGAFAKIDLERFQTYDDQESVRLVSRYLLKAGKISGPIFSLLTSKGATPPVIGVDERKNYLANLDAYKKSVKNQQAYKHILEAYEQRLDKVKEEIFAPDLREFDAEIERYRKHQISFGDYLRFLVLHTSQPSAALRDYLEALNFESSLDFAKAEADRNTILRILAEKASVDELKALACQGLGPQGQAKFYRQLEAFCLKYNVDLKSRPALQAFIRYASLAENINAETVFAEARTLEQAIFKRLTKEKRERELIHLSRTVYLTSQLLSFMLTEEEWQEYKSLDWSVSREIAGSHIDPQMLMSAMNVASFEKFYDEAEARDGFMAENLLRAMNEKKAQTAVLVTGGFHRQGIESRLKAAGVKVISFLPQLKTIDNADEPLYLSRFLEEKMPLEKLFSGEVLFMARDPASGEVLRMGGVEMVEAGRGGSVSRSNLVPRLKQLSPGAELVRATEKSGMMVRDAGSPVGVTVEVKKKGADVVVTQKMLVLNPIRYAIKALDRFVALFTQKASYRTRLALAAFFTFILTSVAAFSATLEWDRNPEPNVMGYRVYYGEPLRGYTSMVDVGNTTTFKVAISKQGITAFAVTAYDDNGLESDYSDEILYENKPPTNPVPMLVIQKPVVQPIGKSSSLSFETVNLVGGTISVETSTNLQNWVSIPVVITRTPIPGIPDAEKSSVRSSILPPSDKRFFRFKYTFPPGSNFAPTPESTPTGGLMEGVSKRALPAILAWAEKNSHKRVFIVVDHLRRFYRAHSTWLENLLSYSGAILLSSFSIGFLGLVSGALGLPFSAHLEFKMINNLAWFLFFLGHTPLLAGRFASSSRNLMYAGSIAAINMGLGFSGWSPLLIVFLTVAVHMMGNLVGFISDALEIRLLRINTLAQACRAMGTDHVVFPFLRGTSGQSLRIVQGLARSFLTGSEGLIHMEAVVDNRAAYDAVNQWIARTGQTHVHVILRENNEIMADIQKMASQHLGDEIVGRARFQLLISPGTNLGNNFMEGLDLSKFETFLLLMGGLIGWTVEFKNGRLSDFGKMMSRHLTDA